MIIAIKIWALAVIFFMLWLALRPYECNGREDELTMACELGCGAWTIIGAVLILLFM